MIYSAANYEGESLTDLIRTIAKHAIEMGKDVPEVGEVSYDTHDNTVFLTSKGVKMFQVALYKAYRDMKQDFEEGAASGWAQQEEARFNAGNGRV